MVRYTSMALDPLNSSNLEQLALKGLKRWYIMVFRFGVIELFLLAGQKCYVTYVMLCFLWLVA